jgi:hypothetical protein
MLIRTRLNIFSLNSSLSHHTYRHTRTAIPFLTFQTASMATLHRSAFLEAIQKHDPQSTAVVHCLSGRSFKYGSLLHDVAAAKEKLLHASGKKDGGIDGERVAFLVENGYDYIGRGYHM